MISAPLNSLSFSSAISFSSCFAVSCDTDDKICSNSESVMPLLGSMGLNRRAAYPFAAVLMSSGDVVSKSYISPRENRSINGIVVPP